jgi:hypothetical protein
MNLGVPRHLLDTGLKNNMAVFGKGFFNRGMLISKIKLLKHSNDFHGEHKKIQYWAQQLLLRRQYTIASPQSL